MMKFAAKAGTIVLILVSVTLGYVYRDVYIRRLPPGWFSREPTTQQSTDLEVVATPALVENAVVEARASSPAQSSPLFTVPPQRQQLMGVRTAPIAYRNFDNTIRTVGIVELDETRVTDIYTKVSGWIEDVYVDFMFQPVEERDPLFTVYSPELLATQEEYVIALKGLDMLGKSQFESVALGAEDLVRAARRRLELWDITDAQIEEIERTRRPIRALTVYSPATGHVMYRDAFSSKRVTPDMKVYTVADHSVVWVQAEIYENEIAWIREGQQASMRVNAFPDEVFTGRVAFIEPHLNEQSRTLRARLEYANEDLRLKPGMYAEIELNTAAGRRLVVPASAVLPTGRRNIVFVDHGEGELEIRNIRLGARRDGYYEILEGLQAGDLVVVSGNFLIDAESKLQAAEPAWQGDEGP